MMIKDEGIRNMTKPAIDFSLSTASEGRTIGDQNNMINVIYRLRHEMRCLLVTI